MKDSRATECHIPIIQHKRVRDSRSPACLRPAKATFQDHASKNLKTRKEHQKTMSRLVPCCWVLRGLPEARSMYTAEPGAFRSSQISTRKLTRDCNWCFCNFLGKHFEMFFESVSWVHYIWVMFSFILITQQLNFPVIKCLIKQLSFCLLGLVWCGFLFVLFLRQGLSV